MTPAIIAVSVHGLGNPSSGPRAARVNHWRRRNGAAAPGNQTHTVKPRGAARSWPGCDLQSKSTPRIEATA
jgi:hypothetical protein